MDAVNNISVVELIGKTLNTREAASELIKTIKLTPCSVCNIFELDFAGVEFMSRSFADQFHKEKSKLVESGECEIALLNTTKEIVDMFTAVAKTQHEIDRRVPQVHIIRFKDSSSLSEYLLSL